MKKEVNFVRLKGEVYFSVYSLIKQGKNPQQISTILKVSKQALNKYIKVLKANNFIQKIGYGVWKTSKLFDFNTLYKTSKLFIRSHAFIFSLSLPKIVNWDNREIFLKKNGIEYKQFSNRNMQKLTFRNFKVQLGNKKIVIYQPKWRSYFVNSAKTGYNYAIYDFQQIIIGLENLFNANFKQNKAYKFNIGRQHHALIHNELAKQFNRNNKKLEVREEKGYLWLLIDKSDFNNLNMEELETVKHDTANNDMDQVVSPFMNKLREDPKILDKMENNLIAG